MNAYLIEKLKDGRLKKGLKQSDVTNLTGIKNTTLSNYENGNTEPDMDTFLQLCELYELDYAEILETAYSYKSTSVDFLLKEKEKSVIEKYRSLDPYGQETVNILLDRETVRTSQIKETPVYSAVEKPHTHILQYHHRLASAGSGEYLLDAIPTDTIEVPTNKLSEQADFVIGVNGDSMAPTYNNGVKVYVCLTDNIPTGAIGIFTRGNECFVKELGSDRLISHNKEYADIPASGDIRLVGKVLGKVEEL